MQRFLPVAMRNRYIMLRDRRSCVKVFASRGNVSQELDSEDNAGVSCSEEDDELSHVIKFKMPDLKIHDCISIALGKRKCNPLFNTRVVLTRLISPLANRRGRRAMEVLRRLGIRRLYHS